MKTPCGRTAFVQLAGRVEEARAVAGGRGDVQLASERLADRGDALDRAPAISTKYSVSAT